MNKTEKDALIAEVKRLRDAMKEAWSMIDSFRHGKAKAILFEALHEGHKV